MEQPATEIGACCPVPVHIGARRTGVIHMCVMERLRVLAPRPLAPRSLSRLCLRALHTPHANVRTGSLEGLGGARHRARHHACIV
jgi:hypothetical protein